ncbi:MAG: type II/IV secretion system protein, partial [Elusimicrobia bacterium]|nr:type II/IV secretion system protein [Elusimicrobiota bacterium]
AAAQSRLPLADAVVKLGLASEEAIAVAVSRHLHVPYASRENKILRVERSQALERIVPESFAREHLIVPLFLEENVLAVAMSAPDDMLLQDNLRVMTQKDIQAFIATKSQILNAIDELYSAGGGAIAKTMRMQEKAGVGAGESEENPDEAERVLDLDHTPSGKQANVVSLVNAILKQAISERCSDIHLESYDEAVQLRFRIDGVLYERPAPQRSAFNALISRIKILSKLDIAERRLPQDGQFSIRVQNRTIDLRVSICPTVFGEKVVMRVLDKGSVELDIDKIGFEPRQKEDFLKAARRPHGLIFLTGPTGSGKTTTLYSVLNTIKSADMNFMTIEDPVEIKMEGLNQVQVHSSIGLTFAAALRSFLRQDPDVILVGEVRDQETAQTCLRAALTGHLVLSTLHTNDAISTVVRLIDMGIEPFLLANSLHLVAAQRLVRLLCPGCKKPYKPGGAELERCREESMLADKFPDAAAITFYQPQGCERCARTGYLGRRAVYEVYLMTQEMRESIYKHGGDLAKLREI